MTMLLSVNRLLLRIRLDRVLHQSSSTRVA
jgi:hypothetical protein